MPLQGVSVPSTSWNHLRMSSTESGLLSLCESAYVLFRPQGHIILLPEIHVSERPTKFVGPIDCLNLKSSFLPLTVYGRPAHQEGHRFCAHSLRRLFRCLLGRIPRRRIGLFSGWSVYPRRSRQEYCRRGNELTDCFFSFCSSTTFFSCTLIGPSSCKASHALRNF